MTLALLFAWSIAFAGGIRDVAPTAADAPVMLEAGREGFNNFADFTSAPEGRLYVSFGRADEVLYLGLSPEYTRTGNPFSNTSTRGEYIFRIKWDNPNGEDPIVHGPFVVSNSTANVNSYAEAEFGVYPTTRTVGGDSVYVFRPGRIGDFYIEFEDNGSEGPTSRVNIPFWDFTVTRAGQVREGRVWSRGWAFRTPQVTGETPPDCVWDREFNGSLYSYTDDGFVSLIDFQDSGFQGLSFNVAFNTTGPGTTGDLAQDRMSIPGANSTENSREHRIFLSLPDPEIFPDGICGAVTSGESFRCEGDEPYCLDVAVTRPGQVQILLDFNGNGVADDGSQDVVLVYEFTEDDLSTCVPWNGLRGDSTQVDFTDTVGVFITYAQGVQHYSAFDVEFLRNGFCVQTVRPICTQALQSSTLFYDDRNIPEEPGTGVDKDGRSGCECGDGCRTWDNFALNPGGTCDTFDDSETRGYGDKSTLNTYWFASSRQQFRARVPVVSARIIGADALCDGEVSTLTAVDVGQSDEDETYLWEGPGVDGATTQTVDVSQAGTYCVTISGTSGCSNRTCTEVTVTDFDSGQFPDNLSICFGESITLPVAGNPAYTYEWTPEEGIDDPTSNQPTFNPAVTTTYSVVITNESATGQVCQTTEQVTITVAPDIGLFVRGGGDICEATTELIAETNVAATVTLFDAAGTALGTGNSFDVPVSGSADYTLIAEAANGCRDTVVFTVSGGPVDIALPDSVLTCISDGVDLSITNLDANDNLTYVWTPANLFDPATVTSANPTFTGGPGDYNLGVTVTNQFGCLIQETINLVLLDDNGELSFTSEVECDGATVNFTNTSTVTFGYLYNFGDGNTSTEANPTNVYAAPGNYTVTLSLIYDGQECVEPFSSAVVTVPQVVGADFTVELDGCDNGSAVLNFSDNSLNATGQALTYAWTFTGVSPTTSTEASPTVDVTGSGEVTASLVVTSADGCESTFDSTFTVDLAIVSLPEEIIICPGGSAALNPDGSGDLVYSWSPSPDFPSDAVNPTTSVAGTYVATVTSTQADFNCINTDTVTVVVADSINLVINGPDGPLNTGDGNGNGGTGGGGTGGGGNGGGTGGGNGELVLPSVQTCGTPVDLSVDLNVDQNVTVTYTDLDGNVLGDGNSLTVNPDGRDTVVITATNQFGCVERDTVVIINTQVDAGIDVGGNGLNVCSAADTSVAVVNNDPLDTLTYVWQPNDIINGPLNGESVDISIPDEGSVDLSVTVTNQFGCDTTLMVTVTSVPFTPNSYADVITPCFGDDITIDGGDRIEGYTYEWEPSDNLDLTDPANPVGNFEEDVDLMVTITDPTTGCSSTQTIAVDVAPEISFMTVPTDTVICAPGNIVATGSSVNENVEIVWYDDAELTNQVGEGETYTIEATEPGETYTVFGEATDPTTGCSQMTMVTVSLSEITAGLPGNSIVGCASDPPGLFPDNNVIAGLVYTYEPADLVDDSDPLNPVFVGTESGSVTVNIVDPNTGCATSEVVEIEVIDNSDVTGMADPADIFLGESTTLTVSGCEDCTYEWFPPNGTLSSTTGPTVTATPDQAGDLVYEVEVVENGCTVVVEIMVRVEDPLCDESRVYVPNAFTPNGDGNNDEMRVRSSFIEQLTEFRWIIYDRWGQEVYSSDDPTGFWDGTFDGDDLEPDVYGYWLRVRCPAGNELIQQGNISILR